jgi:predicted transcriptional regulator
MILVGNLPLRSTVKSLLKGLRVKVFDVESLVSTVHDLNNENLKSYLELVQKHRDTQLEQQLNFEPGPPNGYKIFLF